MDIIFKAFTKIFSKKIENFIQESKNKEILEVIKKAKNEALQEERAYRDEQRNHCLFIELEMMIGKPVISISNEWNNPIIGFGKRIEFITRAKTPVLIIEDYVSGNDMMVLSVPFYFSEQRLFALSKLDPFEICSIIYKNSAWMEPFEKVKSGVFEGYDVIINRLKQTDFFERAEKARTAE